MKTIVAIFLLSLPAVAQVSAANPGKDDPPKKTSVKFVCTCQDAVGLRYATALRDLIAISPRYKMANDFIEGPKEARVPNMGIRVVSLDPQQGPGRGAALAVVITWGAFYVTNSLQICPTDNVRSCAESTLALLDENNID